MRIIGGDYHPSFPQIAFFDQGTGECGERRLNHRDGEAEKFYRELQQTGVRVRVGMEAAGYALWFERLLAELGFELCWRCRGDQDQARPKAENRLPGCATPAEAAAGKSLSSNRGPESGGAGTYTWQCAEIRVSPKWPWPANSPFG